MSKILLIFTILSITGCTLFTVSQREIRKSEKIWKTSGIKNYNYTFSIGSLDRDRECSTPGVGIKIEVRDGKLKKFGTCEINVEKAVKFGTVEKIFETLSKAKSKSPSGLEVRFNEKYGYPEYIDINYSSWFTDHRVQYHIENLKVVE
jgi:hypothetical protein